MEDITDAPYRRLCRGFGAELCVTEFVRAEQLISSARPALRKIHLAADDRPTGIQIYGNNADLLLDAARIAAEAEPDFVDVNCGCWAPKVVAGGSGAAWLRDPARMVAMVARIVAEVPLQVTVKTRIGWGPESHMPIVDLARRLEDVGIAGLTIHCRTAAQGHEGFADWSWAQKAQAVVQIPVIVNGDIRSAADAQRALRETGCAAVMIGRKAISDPWIFRECRALLERGEHVPGPTDAERVEVYGKLLLANAELRGEANALNVTRRHLWLLGPLRETWKRPICLAKSLAETLDVLHSIGGMPRAA
jgi:nifR3 family TIM-barrel protein